MEQDNNSACCYIKVLSPGMNYYFRQVKVKDETGKVMARLSFNGSAKIDLPATVHQLKFRIDYHHAAVVVSHHGNEPVYLLVSFQHHGRNASTTDLMFFNCMKAEQVTKEVWDDPLAQGYLDRRTKFLRRDGSFHFTSALGISVALVVGLFAIVNWNHIPVWQQEVFLLFSFFSIFGFLSSWFSKTLTLADYRLKSGFFIVVALSLPFAGQIPWLISMVLVFGSLGVAIQVLQLSTYKE